MLCERLLWTAALKAIRVETKYTMFWDLLYGLDQLRISNNKTTVISFRKALN